MTPQGVYDVQFDDGPFGSGWRLVVPYKQKGDRVSCLSPERLTFATLPVDAFRHGRQVEGAERRVAKRLDEKRVQWWRMKLISKAHSQKIRRVAETLRCVADGWA